MKQLNHIVPVNRIRGIGWKDYKAITPTVIELFPDTFHAVPFMAYRFLLAVTLDEPSNEEGDCH
jgi:hypothetical protein